MGGFGSGCYGGTATAEGTASYVLAASVLTRARLQVGQRGFGTSYFGEEKFPVEIRVDTTDASNPFLELTHRTRDDSEGDRIVRDRIRLIWTVPTYGGRRWWFLCPRTGRRTIKLFLPIEGMAFLEPPSLWPRLCLPARRSIWSGSTEGCHAQSPAWRRGLGNLGHAPQKPKWMRWPTYERKYERWERAAEKADEEFTIRAARMLKWI